MPRESTSKLWSGSWPRSSPPSIPTGQGLQAALHRGLRPRRPRLKLPEDLGVVDGLGGASSIEDPGFLLHSFEVLSRGIRPSSTHSLIHPPSLRLPIGWTGAAMMQQRESRRPSVGGLPSASLTGGIGTCRPSHSPARLQEYSRPGPAIAQALGGQDLFYITATKKKGMDSSDQDPCPARRRPRDLARLT